MKDRKYLYLALVLGLLLHGTNVFFSFESTYDAFVHIFFADHYAEDWFSSWDQRWYTGFTITSYPPLVHHIIAASSFIVGLKGGFILWSILITLIFLRGVYEFSKLWVNETAANWAVVLAVFSTSFSEALHIFGQLPSITGIAFLLNACPELYKWIRTKQTAYLIMGLLFLGVTTSAHHVTTIFGLVFFIFPVLGLAVIDNAQEKKGEGNIHLPDFFKQAIKDIPRVIFLSISIVFLTVFLIFPYWYWSKTDPITQVPIPHGSRDSFIEVLSSGLVFFVIPWGIMLFFLPFLFRSIFLKRNIFMGISIVLLFILGTGGTTPIPKMMLGENAFNILTLDRFTYWGTILALPFFGLFFSKIYDRIINTNNSSATLLNKILFYSLGVLVLASCMFTVNFRFFKNTQPDKIDIEPIVRFLHIDKHYQWRYLTLGFGDQMAWLSANTKALSVDGNYHSVRRLTEMTSRAVERLENAKYLGNEGIEALRQFLTQPEKFNLKFIFSNDKFYDPLLYYTGWEKVQSLDNNIVVWERLDVPQLSSALPAKEIPYYQSVMWGVFPLTTLFLCFIFWIISFWRRQEKPSWSSLCLQGKTGSLRYTMPVNASYVLIVLIGVIAVSLRGIYQNNDRTSPENLVKAYFNALDFKEFEKAYSLYDPDLRPPIDEYLVHLSLKSGILASYAKLEGLSILDTKEWRKDSIAVQVEAQWLTSLKSFTSTHELMMKKEGMFWNLIPEKISPDIPPDQMIDIPEVGRFKQGKRKLNSTDILHEDILDRPEVIVTHSTLINHEGVYSIVGKLSNVDDVPAFVIVDGAIFNDAGEEVLRYSVTDKMKKHLAPFESTPFRIDFKDIGQTQGLDSLVDISSHKLYVRTMATPFESYSSIGLRKLKLADGEVTGEISNTGARLVVIPQLLISYYCDNNPNPIWVEELYLPEGIAQQRASSFSYALRNVEPIDIIEYVKEKNVYINGLAQSESVYTNRASKLIVRSRLLPTNTSDCKIELKENVFTASIYTE
ncbi:MAG: hypothetical protein HKN09_13955 [Saprospiraceae bacterium]|nr:hypothetical protein [Saprospiraceae bacterium]